MTPILVHPAGALIALLILATVVATILWMVNPPRAPAEIVAQRAERAIEEMAGSILVVFAEQIHSEPMMVLAARLARRERAELLAVYVVEVPLILPQSAAMPDEDRRGYDALAAAEAIAQHSGVAIRTELLHTRQVGPAVVDLAKREAANLIVLGSYREGKYTGAPLGRAIEAIAAGAPCDVLIGVPGLESRMLNVERRAAPRRG
ncbi:MAG TPA: universal stress protein [Candidatus Baltobacteraceae bacterium]|nr:universal stress protein [Candidatus Baltobacteraceae bacterium]